MKELQKFSFIAALPYPFLALVPKDRKFELAIQDISPFPAGAYTGAVTARNLDGFGVQYAIVGHSERRRYFYETNQDVANKVTMCVEAGITPIVCVTRDEVEAQANSIADAERKKCIVVFEPVEHIGTGTTDTLEHILKIRARVRTAFGDVPFLYGGSVDTKSDTELLLHKGIDGFLVGSASLDAGEFSKLISVFN